MSSVVKECVILDGIIINIGPWDYMVRRVQVGVQEVEVEVPDDYQLQDGEEWLDETEGQKKVKRIEPVYEDQATNPLPDGAVIEEREVAQDADGGWVLVEDYAALRRAAYPPYSPWDIIDEILKHITPEPGSKLEQIQAERMAVKQQYPKPNEE